MPIGCLCFSESIYSRDFDRLHFHSDHVELTVTNAMY